MHSSEFFSETDLALFEQGTHYGLYKRFGAHPVDYHGKLGIYFSVWAPHAKKVSLVGNFNGWDQNTHEMTQIGDSGIYEIFTTDINVGDLYQYAILTEDDQVIHKADPYAYATESGDGASSIVTKLSNIRWKDKNWMSKKAKYDPINMPVSIYEVHPGSWKMHRNENGSWYYNYKELASELCLYCKQMGYTHVELIGIPEYHKEESLGYQVTSYYAPTSRYGGMTDFSLLVNELHENNIGVILDWSPAYFSNEPRSLCMFDGKPLYEYEDMERRRVENADASTFNFGDPKVCDFLISNALYWIEQYHIDGLRVNSVSAMIYVDEKNKTNENHEAIVFLQKLNDVIKSRFPETITIADESCAYLTVTVPTTKQGLGFTFKWKSLWMNDFLNLGYDPYFRQFNHENLIKTIRSNGTEHFILPISHEEFRTAEGILFNRIHGNKVEKIANLKAAYTYLVGQPGKKMFFMGQDFAQKSEWSYDHQLDWYQRCDPEHRRLHHFFRDLMTIYKKYGCLYTDDDALNSFLWINADDKQRSIISFVRKAPKSGTNLLFVINFAPSAYTNFSVGVPRKGKYTLILNEKEGLLKTEPEALTAIAERCDNQPYKLEFHLSAYGIAVFKF